MITYPYLPNFSKQVRKLLQEAAYEIITKNFLKKPGYINRSVSKESKVLEFKLQIFFRLELFWVRF